MAQSLARVLVHIVFSTQNREPWLRKDLRAELHRYMATVLNNLDCPAREVGGTVDHIHVLCQLPRTHAISNVVEHAKTSTSKWIKTKGCEFAGFHWQSGYGAFSVSPSHASAVTDYIRGQEEHHRVKTFQEEYRAFLEKHDVAYDEKYVWD